MNKLRFIGMLRPVMDKSNCRDNGIYSTGAAQDRKGHNKLRCLCFGALLLEVSCGRRPIDLEELPEELVLVEWVWEKFRQGRVLDVVDTRLNGQYDEGEMMMVLKLGLICSNHVPVARPSMRKLVRYLDGEVDLPENLTTPVAFDGGAEGFDAFVHFSSSSSSSPSLDNMISYPFLENGNAGTS
ncbi:hypothetical protein F3Y22_tig00009009pilonHSYRG00073 [Hibiscus syriacus]|uniref:Uncharacterized protein n=1 Tax=Hibiscus syriacus TaxID=106335 RepID=A0A6A3C979_HIBSY|nr:hypothetical protein F3Y22_tig00009009pilonHSYRG00073 [Hibiscus syriacus]